MTKPTALTSAMSRVSIPAEALPSQLHVADSLDLTSGAPNLSSPTVLHNHSQSCVLCAFKISSRQALLLISSNTDANLRCSLLSPQPYQLVCCPLRGAGNAFRISLKKLISHQVEPPIGFAQDILPVVHVQHRFHQSL